MTDKLIAYTEATQDLVFDQELESPRNQALAVDYLVYQGIMALAQDADSIPGMEDGEPYSSYVHRVLNEVTAAHGQRSADLIFAQAVDLGMMKVGVASDWLRLGRRTMAWLAYQNGWYLTSPSALGDDFRSWVAAVSPTMSESEISRVTSAIYALNHMVNTDMAQFLPEQADPETGELVPDPEAVFRPGLWRRWWPALTRIWTHLSDIDDALKVIEVAQSKLSLLDDAIQTAGDQDTVAEFLEEEQQTAAELASHEELVAKLQEDISQLLLKASDKSTPIQDIDVASTDKPRVPLATGELKHDSRSGLQDLEFKGLTRAQVKRIAQRLKTVAQVVTKGETYDRTRHVLVEYRSLSGQWAKRTYRKGKWSAWDEHQPDGSGWLVSEHEDPELHVRYLRYIEEA